MGKHDRAVYQWENMIEQFATHRAVYPYENMIQQFIHGKNDIAVYRWENMILCSLTMGKHDVVYPLETL